MNTQALTTTARPRPDAGLGDITKLVLDSLTSVHSKMSYGRSITAFLIWFREEWHGPFNRASVQAWKAKILAAGAAPATVNAKLAAVKKLASEAESNSLLDPVLAAGIERIRGVPGHGVRVGNWLSLPQAKLLLDAPDASTFVGLRDRALLAVLLGCGLRREETAALTFEHIQRRDGRWCVVDIIGKGGRIRTVPFADWVKLAIDAWAVAAGISTGIVFRVAWSRGPGGTPGRKTLERIMLGKPLTPQAIFIAVRRHAAKLGLNIAPHDCRRTFARLARRGRAPIEQIKYSLGHSSVQTTERYLGGEQDLRDAPADRLGLGAPCARRHRARREMPVTGPAVPPTEQGII
jgi:integrase